MNFDLFDAENKALRQHFCASMNEPDKDRYVIYDGPVNPQRYLNTDIKIAWVLKEPYDEQDGTGGGWTFTDLFDKDDLYNITFKEAHKATWHPVIYSTYGIQQDFQLWDEMPYIRDYPVMCDVVRDIAIVNTQKLPAVGVTKTHHSVIERSYNKHKDLLHKQIDMLNADIYIFANTFWLYKKELGLEGVEALAKPGIEYYFKDDKLYIGAYHPAQTTISKTLYVNSIVEAAKEWHLLYRTNLIGELQ
jgi:hypothetical protein